MKFLSLSAIVVLASCQAFAEEANPSPPEAAVQPIAAESESITSTGSTVEGAADPSPNDELTVDQMPAVSSEHASTGAENIYTDAEGANILKKINANYFGILYGPSVRDPSSYQPRAEGGADTNKPVIVKNFLNLGYNITNEVAVTGSAYWLWQPVMKQQMQLQDPFVRVSHNSIWSTEQFNLYGDLRFHFPVTTVSRENQLHFGVQSVQVLTYAVPGSRLTLGTYGSVRVNSFGGQGYGKDLELYIAPNVAYQVAPTVALTVLYEMQSSHYYGDSSFPLVNDGSDLEPGISWDISPSLMLNPYLHVPVGKQTSLNSTSFGMMLNWILL
jgi:hypothetical protein